MKTAIQQRHAGRMFVLVLGAAFLPLVVGCAVGYSGRVEAAAAYPSGDIVVDDDYVYYPGYEVYYSNRRHNYVYRDGGRWVSHSSPPHVSADVLLSSPSVHVDFHDSPEHHHADMIKTYPKNWKPANREKEEKREQKKDRDDDDKNSPRR